MSAESRLKIAKASAFHSDAILRIDRYSYEEGIDPDELRDILASYSAKGRVAQKHLTGEIVGYLLYSIDKDAFTVDRMGVKEFEDIFDVKRFLVEAMKEAVKEDSVRRTIYWPINEYSPTEMQHAKELGFLAKGVLKGYCPSSIRGRAVDAYLFEWRAPGGSTQPNRISKYFEKG